MFDQLSQTNRNLYGPPSPGEFFSALDDDTREQALSAIALKISATPRTNKVSDIPAGSTYLTQFAVHDLDFLTRSTRRKGARLDLAIIYGDGPKHDAHCYQVPDRPGQPRILLRLGRARPTGTSPAWGAERDLPRTSCAHLDANPVNERTDVLVPNTFTDSNMLLGQMHTVWALLHNAVTRSALNQINHNPSLAGSSPMPRQDAFDMAQRILRGIYRDVLINDVLRVWLSPNLRDRYAGGGFNPKAAPEGTRAALEFMSGIGRLGHSLVRDIYSLCEATPNKGLRDIIRHTSVGRPHDMPLTEDWLLDFTRFFKIGPSEPQMAGILGPYVARAFASHEGIAAAKGSVEGLVLRDLSACTQGDLRSVASLIARASEDHSSVFDGYFARDETHWQTKIRDWLDDTGLDGEICDKLAKDPPLTLFLMLEAEADADGAHLGALGSVLMGETLAAAMPVPDEADDITHMRKLIFGDALPACMRDIVIWLQAFYQFADGARLHPEDPGIATPDIPLPPKPSSPGDPTMLDATTETKPPISRIEVMDYVEMGRLVIQWSRDPDSRPKDVDELKHALAGIAIVPDRITEVEFCQSTMNKLILRLPVTEMVEESFENMTDPTRDSSYPLPQFYSDFYRPGFGPVLSPLDMLMSRVGDYTIAQCR